MTAKSIEERIAEEEARLGAAIRAEEQRLAAEASAQKDIARSKAELKRLRIEQGIERWEASKPQNQKLLDTCVAATETMLERVNTLAATMLATVPGVDGALRQTVEQQHEFRTRALNDYTKTLADQAGARENEDAYKRFMTDPEATRGAEQALMLAAPPAVVLTAWVAEMPPRSLERRVRAAIAYCITGDLIDGIPQGTDTVAGYRDTEASRGLFSSGPPVG